MFRYTVCKCTSCGYLKVWYYHYTALYQYEKSVTSAWISLLLWCRHCWQRQQVMSCVHQLQLPWDKRAALKPWQSCPLVKRPKRNVPPLQLLFFDSSVMADLFQLLCLYAPWMPLRMARFSILNCTHFQVNLAHFSHFYRPSARRSAHNSLCHAAHNDVSADPLAGKWTECNCLFDVSLFAKSMKVWESDLWWETVTV